MTFAEIKELKEMGFSHDEIISIMTGTPINQPAPAEPAPVPAPVPAEPAAPAPAEPAAPAPAPAPVPAAQAPDMAQVMAQLTDLNGNISQLVQSVQASNIINSRNSVPQPETVEDVMAQILNPKTNEPIGGNN